MTLHGRPLRGFGLHEKRPAGGKPAGGGHPLASLFAGGVLGDIWDASVATSMFSDAAATTLISTASDTPLRAIRGQVNGNLLHNTAGADTTRANYRSSNQTIETDGTDDYLISPSALFAPYPYSIVVVCDKTTAGTLYGYSFSATGADYIHMGVRSNPSTSSFSDRAAANQFSGTVTMPTYTGGLAGASLRGSSTADMRMRFAGSGSETTIAAATSNTHASGRVVVGAQAHTGGTPATYRQVRFRAVIVANKVFSDTELTTIYSHYGVA